MKAYRYVFDKVIVDGKEYTHAIPRLETYENNFISNLLNARQAFINLGKALGRNEQNRNH
ncbi:hypothetical protein [Macrococcus equi]|uniref:hypothetical protein n=1 Tax=Macrococcus equi TaxID=3395462 RepID=UPI0039BE5D25